MQINLSLNFGSTIRVWVCNWLPLVKAEKLNLWGSKSHLHIFINNISQCVCYLATQKKSQQLYEWNENLCCNVDFVLE